MPHDALPQPVLDPPAHSQWGLRDLKTLEATRIDKHRDDLIGRIETQLKQKQTVAPIFTIRWRIV